MIPIYFAGIDLGSTMTKVVIVDESEKLLAYVVQHTGAEHRRLANKVMEESLRQAVITIDEITYVIATGYGRINVPFADKQITELTCHARGVAHFFPNVRLAIDIGGQDAKGMKVKNGKLIDFVMSDKCAAGTGRYLEVVAHTLGLTLEDLGPISLKSTRKVSISSICTIFAQQEVSNHLSAGVLLEDVVAGLHDAIAGRVARMVRRLKIEPDVVFTGGVAKNIGVIKALEENLGCPVLVPSEPLLSGALGAALIARETILKAQAEGKSVQTTRRKLGEATFFKQDDGILSGN
ncbi:MAG: acyl-CoA dehydratase activase [Dehalococcoidales bacterium]|nr:acyl-CoA dehydratase activase [Dehalococcoidales bacterium]